MLEILLVYGLCKHMGTVLSRKGRKSGWFKFFVVVAWFGGEIAGGLAAAVALAIANQGEEPSMGGIYLGAIVGAGLSVGFVFLIASSLSDLSQVQLDPSGYAPADLRLPRDTGNPYQPPSA